MATIEFFSDSEQLKRLMSSARATIMSPFFANNAEEVKSVSEAYKLAKNSPGTIELTGMPVYEPEKSGLPKGANQLLFNDGAVVGRCAAARKIVGEPGCELSVLLPIIREAVYGTRDKLMYKTEAVIGLDKDFMVKAHLLIPEGSLLFATYNSSVSYGQNKVQVAWNLLIRPDGYRVTLGNMPGVSTQGFSGYEGKVSNHPWQTMKALGMVALYSVIQTEFSRNIKSSENEYIQNAMTDVYTQTSELGNKIIDRALDIKPTITIKEGTEIKLITNVPLELPPVQLYPVTRKYQRTK